MREINNHIKIPLLITADNENGCDTFINTYSADRSAMKAVVDGIFGEFEFKGRSPVSLVPDEKKYEI